MRYRLEERHKRHLARLGVALVPEHLEIEDAEYQQHYADWKITLPRAAHEILHMKVLGHAAWRQHAQQIAKSERVKAQTITHKHEHRHKFPLWVIGVLVLLLGLLIVPRAHCQFSKINSIDLRNNDNSAQGFITYPFKFKAGANCSWSPSGSTFTFNCTGSAAASVSFFSTTVDRQGANLSFTSNTHTLWAVNFPNGITFSNMGSFSPTSDGTGLYDICLYDSSGNLKANEGAHHITGALPEHYAITQTSVTLNAGTYYLGITGNATTANLRGGSTYAFTVLGAVNSATPSSAGACAATITMPTNAVQDTSNMPAVIFY